MKRPLQYQTIQLKYLVVLLLVFFMSMGNSQPAFLSTEGTKVAKLKKTNKAKQLLSKDEINLLTKIRVQLGGCGTLNFRALSLEKSGSRRTTIWYEVSVPVSVMESGLLYAVALHHSN